MEMRPVNDIVRCVEVLTKVWDQLRITDYFTILPSPERHALRLNDFVGKVWLKPPLEKQAA